MNEGLGAALVGVRGKDEQAGGAAGCRSAPGARG